MSTSDLALVSIFLLIAVRVCAWDEGKVQLENWKQAKGSCVFSCVGEQGGENKEMSENWANIPVSWEQRMLHKPPFRRGKISFIYIIENCTSQKIKPA